MYNYYDVGCLCFPIMVEGSGQFVPKKKLCQQLYTVCPLWTIWVWPTRGSEDESRATEE